MPSPSSPAATPCHRRRRFLRIAGLFLAILILLLFFLRHRPESQNPPYDYIPAKAMELGHDRGRIVAFVASLPRENYIGAVRGPVGTLWSGAGSDEDRGTLLAALLRASGQTVRFIRNHEGFGAQARDGNAWTDLNIAFVPSAAAAPDGTTVPSTASSTATALARASSPAPWTGDDLPPEMYHNLTVTVRVTGAALKNPPVTVAFRTADLAGAPLVLSYAGKVWELRGSGGQVLAKGPFDQAADETQTITFTHTGPGLDKPYAVTREVYTRRYPDRRALDDGRNCHVIAIAPFTLPKWAFEKEIELTRGGCKALPGENPMQLYALALSHLVESDKALDQLRQYYKTPAYFTRPRIIITSAFHGKTEEESTFCAIDLRSDSVHVEGPEPVRSAFGVTRSIIEGSLESGVLAKATGSPVQSAFDVMRQFIASQRPSTPERLRVYASSLERLIKETRPGATLTFSLDKDRAISFVRGDGDEIVKGAVTPALQESMAKSKIKWGALAAEKFPPAEIGQAALEMETLFGPAAGAPVDYRPAIDLQESSKNLLFANSRIFTYSTVEPNKPPILFLEFQFKQTVGDITLDSVNYWDPVKKKPNELRQSLRIPKTTVESGDMFSDWFSQGRIDAGAIILMFSRKMYRELKETGATVIRFRRYDGTVSEPIKLYLYKTLSDTPIFVNNQRQKVTLLYVAGGYVKDNPQKTDAPTARQIIDQSDPDKEDMNRFNILDNPDFPLVDIRNARFQTSIPGFVRSTATGLGVPDAAISVEDAGSSGTSWGDGRFLLPIIKTAFHKFQVSATAPGYAPFRKEIDFAAADAFPLKIELTPVVQPEAFLWISAANLDQELPKLSSQPQRDLLRMELSENPALAALAPREAVPYGASAARAWLLLDGTDYQFVGVGEDGLHASSSFTGGLAKDWAKDARGALKDGGGNPYGLQQDTVNYFFGHIAAWYVYSSGRLDAITQMLNGKQFDDLGHDNAMKIAYAWIDNMAPMLGSGLAGKVGVNGDMFRVGFMDALKYFNSNPDFRGR